jgi:hypothetical protein
MARQSAADIQKNKARMEVARAISTLLKTPENLVPEELRKHVADFSTQLYDELLDDSPEIFYMCLERYEQG